MLIEILILLFYFTTCIIGPYIMLRNIWVRKQHLKLIDLYYDNIHLMNHQFEDIFYTYDQMMFKFWCYDISKMVKEPEAYQKLKEVQQ